MRKQNAEFKTAFTSEANQNLKNTDSFGCVELDKFACYVIADGIDDRVDATGAKLAVDTIISTFQEAPSMRKSTLRRCLREANKALKNAQSKMKLKASVTMVVSDYAKLRYAQAGNTRLRLYRDGFLRVQSQDQSLSMDLVRSEKLEPDKLEQHEERHNLYCYLGQEDGFSPYISRKFKLSNADAIVLFTRGIWEHLDDGELKDVMADATDDPQPTVDVAEDLLLSRQPKKLENYTLAAIFCNKIFTDPNRRRKIQKIIMAAIPILLVAVVLAVILFVLYRGRQNDIAEMERSFYDTIEYIQSDNYIRAKESCQKALDLAVKLKDESIQADTSNYMKLIESVLAGDEQLDSAQYADAQRSYLNAQSRSRYADNLGRDYIADRLEQTAAYLSVYDMLSLGDTLAANLQPEKAEEQYLAAKALAGRIYFDKGRDDAIRALEQLYTDQKAELEENAAAAQQAADDQAAAAGVLSEGDAAFARGDYESALAFYTTAMQKYDALEDEAQIAALQVKVNAAQNKLDGQREQEQEAGDYMARAETAYLEHDYIRAKKYYLLAKDVYAQLKNDDKVAEVTRRIELVELGVSEAAAQSAPTPEPTETPEPEQTPDPSETPEPIG